MAFSVHDTGRRSALANIGHGNVDTTSPWSFTAADGNALLGTDGNDTASYAKAHLGIDPMNPDPLNKFAYPVAKGGIVYRSGLAAASHNASNAGDNEVADVADGMIDMMDGGTTSSGDTPDTWSAYPFEYKLSEATPGTFEGYASVFNVKDDNGDLILPGSFGRTLAASQASGRSVKMFVNHAGFATGTVTANDLIPCGVWTRAQSGQQGPGSQGPADRARYRPRQIHVCGAQGARAVGYVDRLQGDQFHARHAAGDPRRSISELSLYEISPVFYPANPEARITSVASLMSRGGDPRDIRFLERVLRDVGLSGREAKAVLAGGFKAMVPPRDAGASNSLDGLLGALRHVSSLSRST